MLVKRERVVDFNWTAIVAYAGSLMVSLAVWIAIIRTVQHFVK